MGKEHAKERKLHFVPNLIHFTILGGVPGVAQASQVKTVRPLKFGLDLDSWWLYELYLGIHVTPVGWSGLSIDAVIAKRDILKKASNKFMIKAGMMITTDSRTICSPCCYNWVLFWVRIEQTDRQISCTVNKMLLQSRDVYGTSQIPQIQLILWGKISCIRGSRDVP